MIRQSNFDHISMFDLISSMYVNSPKYICLAIGNATSHDGPSGSPARRASEEEGSGTDCGGSSPPPLPSLDAHPHAAQLGSLARLLHWGYLLNLSLSLYLGALSSLPKLATCQKSGAAAAWRQARNALKGQIALLALPLSCPTSLGRQWR